MGDSGQLNTQESTREMLQALAQYAPDAIKAINSTVMNTAQTNQDVSSAISPQAAQTEYDLYSKFGPQFNELGAKLDRQNQLNASENELAIANGPGKGLVTAADQLQRQVDPEFYKGREAVGAALTSWLSQRDPSKLTGSEQEEIARGLGRTNASNIPSALQTVQNAQAFGQAGDNKWKDFGNAVSMAASALPGLKAGYNGFEVATRRALTPNSGDKRLSGPTDPNAASQTNFGFANNALGQIGANQRLAEGKKTSMLDDVLKGTQAFSNVAQGVSSFV